MIVSLPAQVERREAVVAALRPFEAIADMRVHDAIDGSSLTSTDLRSMGVALFPGWCQPLAENPWDRRELRRGEIGCGLSHLAVWRDAQLDERDTLVFEDDAEPCDEGAARRTADTIAELAERGIDWDLLYLGRGDGNVDAEEVIDGVVRTSFSYCTHGYVVRARAARALASCGYERALFPVDELLPALYGDHRREDVRRWAKGRPRLIALAMVDEVVRQRPVASIIERSSFIVDGEMTADGPSRFDAVEHRAGFGLSALVSPLPLSAFLAEHWPHTSCVSHGPLDRLGGLASIPALQGVEALLAAMPADSEVVLFGPNGFRSSVPSRVAIDFYRRGDTLYFTNVERHVAELSPLRARLASDVGLPVASLVCEAFASAPGAVSSLHYDFDVNFNVLLAGSKRWQLAPNDQIEAPEHSFVVGHSPWLESAISRCGVPPARPTGPSQQEIARAGSVVFLPRGIWHETFAETACFGLNFTFKPRSWYQLVGQALAQRLREDARFRAYPFGALSAGGRAGAAAELDALLPLAVERLKDLSFEELALAFQAPKYRWSDGAPPVFDEACGELTAGSGEALALDEPLWPLARALTAIHGTFSPSDLLGQDVGLALDQLHVALRALCKGGLLRRMRER